MFTVHDRERVRDAVLALASSDRRVVAGAVVGSQALTEGDRWSDLDLAFAVSNDVPVADVLNDWTQTLVEEHEAVRLFDLPYGPFVYRVFLLPGCLQLDLSFAPAAEFGALGPEFRLLFGSAIEKSPPAAPDPRELLGYAVHHVVRARTCIERGRYWQAEYWISAARDYALSLGCLARRLPARFGRGFDALPADVHDMFRGAFVSTLSREALERALATTIGALVAEADSAGMGSDKALALIRNLATQPPHA